MDNIPVDILVEIFSHLKEKYSLFRCINQECRKFFLWWDGWDSLITQGYRVKITCDLIEWTKNGEKHRENDLPALEWKDNREWYYNGVLHRDNGLPAAIYPVCKKWYRFGRLHRDNNLPAILFPKTGRRVYYLGGKKISS